MLHNEDYAHDETNPHYESIGSDIVIFSEESNLGALKPSFEYVKLLLSHKRKLFPLKHTYATHVINILMH